MYIYIYIYIYDLSANPQTDSILYYMIFYYKTRNPKRETQKRNYITNYIGNRIWDHFRWIRVITSCRSCVTIVDLLWYEAFVYQKLSFEPTSGGPLSESLGCRSELCPKIYGNTQYLMSLRTILKFRTPLYVQGPPKGERSEGIISGLYRSGPVRSGL